MNKRLLFILMCFGLSINVFADDGNSFSNANLRGYLDSHDGSMSVVSTPAASKSLPTDATPTANNVQPQVVNHTTYTTVNNNYNDGGGYYDDGYYGGYPYGYDDNRFNREDARYDVDRDRAIMRYNRNGDMTTHEPIR